MVKTLLFCSIATVMFASMADIQADTITNVAPVAANHALRRNQDSKLRVPIATLLGHDTDPGKDGLTLRSVGATSAAGGTVVRHGKWIAYTSNESGDYEIYVRSFPDTGGKWQVSSKGGTEPRWRRNGKELFYVSADRKLMAVDVKTGATFEAGTPHALFDLHSGWEAFTSNYAVTKDGQRFLLPISVEVGNTAPLAVVLNWTALLKR